MLEGLEVSEVLFSQLSVDNEKFRLDDEFFKKEYLQAYRVVKAKRHSQLGDILEVLTDFHANGSYENIAKNFQLLDEKNFAYMVRTTDLENNNYVHNVKYISKKSYVFLSKTKVFGGELIINKIGTPGRTFLMPKLDMPCSLGMNLFMLKVKENTISETFIWAYLNTKFGQQIIQRKVNGTVPLTIDKEAIKSLYIFKPSCNFEKRIDEIKYTSFDYEEKGKEIYTQAEQLLLSEIGLQNFTPSTEAVNIKSFADSFATSGRLDAEYYQPKYEQIVTQIEQQQHDHLDNLVTIKKSIEPGSKYYTDEGLAFLRVSDYSKQGLTEPQKYLSDEFIQENVEKIALLKPKKDTILFSKDGSVGTAYQLREDFNGITSGAILHLNIKNEEKLLPEYLTLVLNSELVQLQAERDAGGSIILHWRVSEIENVVIPIISLEKQQQVADLVEQSFALKQQSEHLLEVAKRAVEIAIEESEDVAMAYIESEVATNE